MKNDMKDKIKKIKQVSDDINYLRDEYESIKLWGSAPDGDVDFNKLISWLTDNRYVVEHMIKTGEIIKELS